MFHLTDRVDGVPVLISFLPLEGVNQRPRDDPDVFRVFLHGEGFSGPGLSVCHDGGVVALEETLKPDT